MKRFGALAAVFCASTQQAQAALALGAEVSFVACPIAQDTGPNTDLCFITYHKGQRVSLSTAEFDTVGVMLKHKVLVEGRLSDAAKDCGGVLVEGQISPLTELSLECDEIRPFEPRFAITEVPQPEELEILKRLEAEPALSLRPMFSGVPAYSGPPLLRWQMVYTFGSDRGDATNLDKLIALATQAATNKPIKIRVRGYQKDARLEDGSLMREPIDMAERRANKVAGIIAGLGYPIEQIEVAWHTESAKRTAGAAWKARRVEVEVIPK